jgi:FixJ family two-component response regulator
MSQPLGHIQLVDDSPDVRFHLADLLRKVGYSVEAFEGAEDFFSKALDLSPAVVLMDMRMPGLTGLEVQARLKAQGRRTPVIFISGQSQPQEVIDAMKRGAVDFLLKPFTREQLVEAVDRGLALDRQNNVRFLRMDQMRRRFGSLSPREREVFFLILQGHPNRAIATVTGVQAGTIKKHRAAVLEKMMVTSAADLIQMCEGVDLDALSQSAPRDA